MFDQTFDRLQKLVSQLELLDEKLSQEDVNKKLLRNLSPEWNTHAVVWMNKADLDTMSMDDLYNNLNMYEPEVKGMLISSNNVILYYHLSHDCSCLGELKLSSLDVVQGFSFFLQMGFTFILATLDGLDACLLGDVIGEDDCDNDG
ncbi:hypothetical protein Tco_0940350 [Tanacetum coccineum]|uniref:Uncharacterized protein n=1 Tax=Tanacetum coccineum TaxID=301880 RepID=A0ABQ5DMS2_9ASTR